MKAVRILKGLAGIDYTFPAGSIQELEDEKAERFVNAGLAEWENMPRNAASRKASTRRTATKPTPQPQKKQTADTPLPPEGKDKDEAKDEEPEKKAPARKKRGRKTGRKPKSKQ